MSQENLNDYLYSWNAQPPAHLKTVRIDDDIRDGMQAAFIRRPSLTERKELLDLSIKTGTYSIVLGYPAVSPQEYEECLVLLKHVEQQGYDVLPTFLSRLAVQDLESIVALNEACPRNRVRAEMFIGTSPLRRKVEGWDFEANLARIPQVGKFLNDNNTDFGISLEDGTRAPPQDLDRAIKLALDAGVKDLAICDTVGDCTPDGAARITEFYMERIAQSGQDVELVWHGHNDKGLSVANALASASAGADTISGTFLGIGERAGNTPLEQVIMLLHQAGNEKYNLAAIQPYCEKWSEYADIAIMPSMPLVGKQAFATGAGTHSAAVLKARKLGIEFEDAVFSSIAARELGRVQDVVVTPTSGKYNAHYILEQIGLPPSDQLASELLEYAKSQNTWMNGDDIRRYFAGRGLA
ncbi:hypothetical protein VSS37_09680 [Candidatus Thiothrix sp. Deng01]|uniref:2-isopropylmalate synthase n=1 Tax=Candidatus Thiothrix phosphatis TaxID=3112415 RepID=A0ABU6CXD5_9GAMM|nr:hypothetical protein [Candidatus Thiothrix sp. Deng01]MEB4591246.1 hypothetical protein [Candidatus Thiothrix sp. Deng01]